jgi:hypothetical protein
MTTIKTRKGTLRHQQSTCIHMRNKMLISEIKIQLKSFKRFERTAHYCLRELGKQVASAGTLASTMAQTNKYTTVSRS